MRMNYVQICSTNDPRIGRYSIIMSYYVGDPMLDAGMSELDKVTVLQDFMLL